MQRGASGLYHPSERHVASRIGYGIVVFVVIAVVAFVVYIWRQNEVSDLREQAARQSGDIAKLQSDIATLKQRNQAGQSSASAMHYVSQKNVTVVVYVPAKDAQLSSPLAVMGEVPGNWSFEASFPVKLLDSRGKVVAQGPAQLLGDWMTDQLVPFSLKLPYSLEGVSSGGGTLVLQKDNPSGLASNDDSVMIPVKL